LLSADRGAYALAHVALSLAGLGGALVSVPLATFIQHAPPPGSKGKAFAVNNFMNFVCILLAGAFYQAGAWLGAPPALLCVLAGALLMLMLWRRRNLLGRWDLPRAIEAAR
jgi:hypothetical protein